MKNLCRLLVLLALVLAGCGRTGSVSSLVVTGPVLPDGEQTGYVLLSAGREVGTLSISVRHEVFRDVPAYRLDVVARSFDAAGETVDSSVVYATRDSMVPLTTFRFIVTGGAKVTAAANYVDSLVAVSYYSSVGEKEQLLPFPPHTYDVDQLTTLGRVVRVRSRQPVSLNVVSSMGPPPGGAIAEAGLAAAGDETVRVPAGTFDCYKLTYTMGEQSVLIWYEKAGAHRMVRYRTADGELEMLLAGSLS